MSLPVQMEIFLALGKDNQRRVSSPKFRLLNRIAEIPPAPSKRGVNRLFYRNWKFNNASFLVYARGIFFYWINGFIENLSAILNARFYRIFSCALKNFFCLLIVAFQGAGGSAFLSSMPPVISRMKKIVLAKISKRGSAYWQFPKKNSAGQFF